MGDEALEADTEPGAAPLAGLTVVSLHPTLPAAFAAWFLADAGADVVLVEPSGGSPLRRHAAWPVLARGQHSVVLDLTSDRAGLDALLADADVVLTAFSPAALRAHGLTGEELGRRYPRLVSASITAWGREGPWSDLPGYEALVMAKLGYCHVKRKTTMRPGPAFISVPFASWGAAHTALHGILAALWEREDSGRGQHVDADLVRGAATMDTWNWFTELVGERWPDAFTLAEAFDDAGRPQGHLIYPLLVAPTSDGAWMQFAQVDPTLFRAMLAELDLLVELGDPRWAGMPMFADMATRVAFWELLLDRVSSRSLAEWEEVFETNPDISAEVFRGGTSGPAALDHPQLRHDRRIATIVDPTLGVVRAPSTLVHAGGRPLRSPAPAPALGSGAVSRTPSSTPPAPGEPPATGRPPLTGVTVLELGLMYAAPYGATLLADLGARVIKVESRDGDGIRGIAGFPEAGGAKVMQGKESVAVDLGTAEGRAIVQAIAARADVVLQGFRAGAAARAGVDDATLTVLNPDLVYLNAPGYGTDGPFGGRPAYAPSIGAASGLGLVEAPDAAERVAGLDEVKATAARLNAASAVIPLQADGLAAVSVASAMVLGLLARRRGRPLAPMTTTMLASATHALVENVVDYPDRPAPPGVDGDSWGFSALYRMYPATDGFVMLAAPTERDWTALVAALAGTADLSGPRFCSPAARAAHDTELAVVLSGLFATRGRDAWERDLTSAGVGCVAVTEHAPERILRSDAGFDAGYSVTAVSPVFDEHRRLAPVTRFSRSGVRAEAGCLLGEHTEAVLAELGYDAAAVADLRARGVVL